MVKENNTKRGVIILGFTFALIVASSVLILGGRKMDVLKPGPGVTKVKMLSDYFPPLKGTNGDSPIYFLEGKDPGGTALALGGTHPPELAGPISAVMFIENAKVTKGRLIVIPRANQSAASFIPSQGLFGGVPAGYTIPNKEGQPRYFRLGDRYTNPADQWPDPDYYFALTGAQSLSGNESLNLNRSYPGDPRGSFSEKIAWAIMEVIRRENAGVAYDIHEATPGSRLAGLIVGNPSPKEEGMSALEIATLAALDLESQGMSWRPERSSETFKGLSHREWGDYSGTYSFLTETDNPEWERTKPFDALSVGTKFPLEERVGRSVRVFIGIVDAYSSTFPEKSIVIEGMPSYDDFKTNGLSPYLN